MRVAIIVQRYGTDFAGGSEYLSRLLAEQMNKFWDVKVFTTCAKDYTSWANEYPSGPCYVNDVKVERFLVERPRDFGRFSQFSYSIETNAFSIHQDEEFRYFVEQGPYCPQLVDAIKRSYDDFDIFIFFTYLYYPTVFGLPEVADKAYLMSTAHDEPPFYFLRTYAPLFHSLKGIIFLSEDEQNLINRVYALPSHIKQIKCYFGISEAPVFGKEETEYLREKYKSFIHMPYFLYLGRASELKRCYDFIHAYSMMTAQVPRDMRIVFAGSSEIDFAAMQHPELIYLGFIDERDKAFLLQNSLALVNPSALESLSLVVLEAWANHTPVVVNGNCTTTKQLCINSGGGLYYHSEALFQGILKWLIHNPSERWQLASQGHNYVSQNYNWHNANAQFFDKLTP